ncbi:hypothetical protein Y958_24145 [Nitrospirillum viridazoti CBAmc]|uniref:Uncharacterized protein n=1 Tax=Nitrospirillum viridazoti CBAmc TaxID=1441467 RepID=A0A248JZ92_9PROT|nr:hypothetical protein Y958_24145 [Nitrospirillum amazonense CBAmc]
MIIENYQITFLKAINSKINIGDVILNVTNHFALMKRLIEPKSLFLFRKMLRPFTKGVLIGRELVIDKKDAFQGSAIERAQNS